uniref:calpain-8-like n=1 Tax=Myxine glutinosa TaxID=7769 RepID=UPI00358E4665
MAGAEGSSAECPLSFCEHQDYEGLRDASLAHGQLFCDPLFKPGPGILGDSGPGCSVCWLRPPEICPQPYFILEGATTTDICQGALWDCWLLAATSSLTLDQRLFDRVVPPGQGFGKGYCGIFHFKFWQYGNWVEVIIDDRLPCAMDGRLLYTCSSSRNEFWSALLEKAYAKVNGSYDALRSGKITEAMEDFTGGVGESYVLRTQPQHLLWSTVLSALSGASLLACFIKTSHPGEPGQVNNMGLVMGHAYAILGVDSVCVEGHQVQLVRLRNPWGYQEYAGAWNDRSKQWMMVSHEEKCRLRLQQAEDGEFWMSFEDFMKNFTNMEICSFSPDSTGTSRWVLSFHQGRWVAGCSAGGCRKFNATVWVNPQFQLSLTEVDDDCAWPGAGCTLVVALMQKHRRAMRRSSHSSGFLYIGFSLYSVPPEVRIMCRILEPTLYLGNTSLYSTTAGQLPSGFFTDRQPVAECEAYCNSREVTSRLRLPPGRYVILPSTYYPEEEADFFLRTYAKRGNSKITRSSNCFMGRKMPFPTFKSFPRTDFSAPEEAVEISTELKNKNGDITEEQFVNFMNNVFPEPLQLTTEACRQLTLPAKDANSCLDEQQAKMFVNHVCQLQEIFQMAAQRSSLKIDHSNLSQTLQSAGFNLDPEVCLATWRRFAGPDGALDFSQFVCCASHLRRLCGTSISITTQLSTTT